MSDVKIKGPVPRLRFPEFRNAGPWDVKRLGKVFDFLTTNSFSRDMLNYEHGELKNIHYGDIHTKFSSHINAAQEDIPFINKDVDLHRVNKENHCAIGDVIFADASEDIDDIGKAIEIIELGSYPLLSGLHTIHARPKRSSFALGFCGWLFQSDNIRKQIQREAQGAKVLGISRERLAQVALFIPPLTEQQKIADCLSSLDDLIRAEEERLEALKEHKKGLMQQLFPAPGETIPRLRFPEFRNAGPWEVKRLGDIASICKGKGISKKDIAPNGILPCIHYGELYTHYHEIIYNIISYTNIESEKLVLSASNDVIIPASGETHEDIAKSACILQDGVALGGDLNVIRPSIDGIFLSYYLNSAKKREIARIAQGNSVVHLYPTQLEKLKIGVPPLPEQQKIADCLSSLDDLIRTQTEKIEALKQHKKGLMQQLFPQEVG